MPRLTRLMLAAVPAALVLAAGFAVAEDTAGGDIHRGKAITKGAPEVTAEQACSTCHGGTGEGNAESGIPRLAGQGQAYLLGALEDYASGARHNEVMTPIAKALKESQRKDVTAYYASIKESEWKKPKDAKEALLRRGETLASVGSAELGVQGCMNCHGPQGRGLPPTAPYLAGQSEDYLKDRLKDWKAGPQSDEAEGAAIMSQIASHLRDEDIAAVAAYFAAQPPAPIRLGEAKP